MVVYIFPLKKLETQLSRGISILGIRAILEFMLLSSIFYVQELIEMLVGLAVVAFRQSRMLIRGLLVLYK
jgi:hypothetical protein